MEPTRLPVEVELVYEVMPCNALRTAQEPGQDPHPCSYFRKWGRYHSYDYVAEGPPSSRGIEHESVYLGRASLVPEILSGCRKAPIMAVGINPNLPGWWSSRRRSLNPVFDDYKQYAHYFRYRATAKLQMPEAEYLRFGGGPDDSPFSDQELDVPKDGEGRRPIHVELARQQMYDAYQALLDGLSDAMRWGSRTLVVGEDLSYANMVACPSARWTTRADTRDPELPPMSVAERNGIVTECFRERRYFLRQLFQSLPAVILVFSQNTARAFIRELQSRFVMGSPSGDESIEDLLQREVRLSYGDLDDGTSLEARVIFAPHITGDPEHYEAARVAVVSQLAEEAERGHLVLDRASGRLRRPKGACVFCPMLGIGPCDYVDELQPLSPAPRLTADSPASLLQLERTLQTQLMDGIVESAPPVDDAWAETDQPREEKDG